MKNGIIDVITAFVKEQRCACTACFTNGQEFKIIHNDLPFTLARWEGKHIAFRKHLTDGNHRTYVSMIKNRCTSAGVKFE